jgi:SAM-dependent methyltransferase
MNDSQLPKAHLRWSPPRARRTVLQIAFYVARSLVLSPIYWALAYTVGTPGLHFRRRCLWVATRVMLGGAATSRMRRAYELVVQPMDSFRYFEFDFAWRCLRSTNQGRYLDVSSPRLLPLLFIADRPRVDAVLLNPDPKDLPATQQLAHDLGVSSRCEFGAKVIADADLKDGSFDLITCISVVEHIPNDTAAIQRMWELLKPGGRLILTTPCAQNASAEFVDRDEYEVLGTQADGFVFWQRYYDENLLRSRIFSVTGLPVETVIYGEKSAGLYNANIKEKMSGKTYPGWQEPYMMGSNYKVFESISRLPGMAVVGFLFVKPNSIAKLS